MIAMAQSQVIGFKMKIKLIFLCFFISSHVYAERDLTTSWKHGLDMFAGLGLNITKYEGDDDFTPVGYGFNIKTDLVYNLSRKLGVEWSANVKFNHLDSYLIWDTLMTVGMRYRIDSFYVRGFWGRAPAVVFFQGNPPEEYESLGASREQFNGPIYGIGFGRLIKNSKDQIWFIEYSISHQHLKTREAIKMRGEVPVVVAKSTDRASVYTAVLSLGFKVF